MLSINESEVRDEMEKWVDYNYSQNWQSLQRIVGMVLQTKHAFYKTD